jgi:hypothetical protein
MLSNYRFTHLLKEKSNLYDYYSNGNKRIDWKNLVIETKINEV